MAGMDEGKGKQGQGQARARASRQRQDETRKTEKDHRSAAGSRVITRSGITHGNEGDEAAVAFYPDLILTRPDQGIYTTTATLCAK